MLTTTDSQPQLDAIEQLRERRTANVRKIQGVYGSWVDLGKRLEQSPSFLVAIAGPNPRRTIGEKLARDIERALTLPLGWLDETH